MRRIVHFIYNDEIHTKDFKYFSYDIWLDCFYTLIEGKPTMIAEVFDRWVDAKQYLEEYLQAPRIEDIYSIKNCEDFNKEGLVKGLEEVEEILKKHTGEK